MDRNRLLLLGGAALVAVVVVVAVVALATGGGSSSPTTTTTSATGTQTSEKPGAAFAGVPQHGDTLGNPNAPVTLTVFEDPQCPFCRDWDVAALPAVVTQFVRTGQVKVVYKGIDILGPKSLPGLLAIYAAAPQNKLWNMVNGLYQHQGTEQSGWITNDLIRSVATDAGADPNAILSAESTAAAKKMLQRAMSLAASYGIQGTPTFVLTRPLSQPAQLNAPLDAAGFTSTLAAALK